MLAFIKEIGSILREATSDFFEDKAPQQGAALAFYSLLSIAPLLMIAIAIAASVFGEDAARGQLDTQIRDLVGDEGAQAIQSILKHAHRPSAGTVATAIGIVTLLFGASGVFGQLQEAMNTIWDVPPKPEASIWDMVRRRFLSFAMVLVIGFLLLVSLVLSTAISAAGKYLHEYLPGSEAGLQLANTLTSLAIITVLFALIFKVLPDATVAWRDVWLGAFLTSLLFTVGKLLIGLYLGRSGMASAYGTAGSLVVLIVWVYYSAQILFFGGEMTHVYAQRHGSKKKKLAGESHSPEKSS